MNYWCKPKGVTTPNSVEAAYFELGIGCKPTDPGVSFRNRGYFSHLHILVGLAWHIRLLHRGYFQIALAYL